MEAGYQVLKYDFHVTFIKTIYITVMKQKVYFSKLKLSSPDNNCKI